MGGPTTAPQQGLVLPQKPFRDELASEASEPSEARRAVISQTGPSACVYTSPNALCGGSPAAEKTPSTRATTTASTTFVGFWFTYSVRSPAHKHLGAQPSLRRRVRFATRRIAHDLPPRARRGGPRKGASRARARAAAGDGGSATKVDDSSVISA